MSILSSKNNSKKPTKHVKYSNLTDKNDEILINDDYSSNNSSKSAFDYNSIHEYKSIYKYSNMNKVDLYRAEGQTVNSETKSLAGVEKHIYNFIVFVFYLGFVLLMPLSLMFCLKKVKNNEKLVVYRLGRTIKPAYEPGYHILFPFIDAYNRIVITQKEISLPNLQVFNHENSIIEISTIIRYQINDVIKMQNTLISQVDSLKSIARSLLIATISKKDANKLELELYYVKSDIKKQMNETINKWGLEITDIEIAILSIIEDESKDRNEDPALKSLTTVFKSLFGGDSGSGGSPAAMPLSSVLPQSLITMLQPQVATPQSTATAQVQQMQQQQASDTNNKITGSQLLKLIEPFVNEKTVKEIQTVYEFHIKTDEKSNNIEKYYLNLKYGNGSIGPGSYNPSNAVDCMIKISANDMTDIFMERLKPFDAYMSGKIEINGSLQDVLRLKTLIKIPNNFN